MNRYGQILNPMPIAILLGGLVMMLLMGALYTSIVLDDAGLSNDKLYTHNIVGSEVMGAACATASRGVFYKSAVFSGEFDCLNPRATVFIRFRTDSWSKVVKIVPAENEPTVDEITVRSQGEPISGARGAISGQDRGPQRNVAVFNQRYSVLVHDTVSGTTMPATMAVAAE